ncbi:MAG TPA: hypothetical protein VH880_07890 [Anaeromyxobacteraceae bacterium]
MSGEVVVAGRDSRPRRLGAVEVRFIPEADMAPFVSARMEEARRQLDRLRREGEQLRAEVERLRAENDLLNQRWKATTDRDLRRRLELQFSRDLTARDIQSAHAELVKRKKAAWERAVKAARAAEAKEREYLALRRVAPLLAEGPFFLEGLPPAVQAVKTDAEGRFQARLGSGRYAVVASAARPPAEGGSYTWLVWKSVGSSREQVSLTSANLHGTDCAECVVAVRGTAP